MNDINEFHIYLPEELDALKSVEEQTPNFFGYVYFVEYGDYIKIGQTKNIYERMKYLKRQSEKYSNLKFGRIAISPKCTNYRKLEQDFHKHFNNFRKKGSELFEIPFYDLIYEVLGTHFQYLDESKEIEAECKRVSEGFMNFVLSGYGLERGTE